MDDIKQLNPPAAVVVADHATHEVEVVEFSNLTRANNAHATMVDMVKGFPTSSHYTDNGCKVTNALLPANKHKTVYHATTLQTVRSEELD